MKMIAIFTLFLTSSVYAQIPHSFISGEKIKASEINANFLALLGSGGSSTESKEYHLIYQSSFETAFSYFDDNFLNKSLAVSLFYQDLTTSTIKAMRADFRLATPVTPSETTKETCLAAGYVWRVTYSNNTGMKDAGSCTYLSYAGYFYDSSSAVETIVKDNGKESLVRLMTSCSAENYSSQSQILGFLWFKSNIRAQRPISECDFR